MKRPTFGAFTPTQFDDEGVKHKFAEHFVKFVEAGMPPSMFPDWFYKKLSHTFGHIAHYNRDGFLKTWFMTPDDRQRFIERVIRHPAYGDPAFTYSDVEKALKAWVVRTNQLERYTKAAAAETEKTERAELAYLKAKYEPQNTCL